MREKAGNSNSVYKRKYLEFSQSQSTLDLAVVF